MPSLVQLLLPLSSFISSQSCFSSGSSSTSCCCFAVAAAAVAVLLLCCFAVVAVATDVAQLSFNDIAQIVISHFC